MRKPSYFNSEGYPSPTEYFGELHIMQEERARKNRIYAYRPMVYICSQFAGNVKTNVLNARRYSRFAVKKGCLPITPHLLFPQFLDDRSAEEREIGMYMGIVLMSKCEEVWVFGENFSEGMKREIERAKHKSYRLRYFTQDLKEVISE